MSKTSYPPVKQPDGTTCYSGPNCRLHGVYNTQSQIHNAQSKIEDFFGKNYDSVTPEAESVVPETAFIPELSTPEENKLMDEIRTQSKELISKLDLPQVLLGTTDALLSIFKR